MRPCDCLTATDKYIIYTAKKLKDGKASVRYGIVP